MELELFDSNNWIRRVYEKDTSGLALRNLFTTAYHNPNPCIYVFDGKNGKEARRKIFPGYKEGRKPADDQFYVTLELFKMLVLCTNKLVICIDGWEADDVIATLVKQRSPGMRIKIWSNDGDYYRLCDGVNVSMTDVPVPLKDIPLEDQHLYKALVGDKSDKIPGLRTFGPESWNTMVEKGLKKNWQQVFSERRLGDFKAEDLHVTNSQWLTLQNEASFKELLAMYDIIGFINVPKDLMDMNTKVGKPNLVEANAILKTVHQ